MLGADIGRLLADKLSDPRPKSVAWARVALGVLTTLPLAKILLGHRRDVQG